MNIVFIMTDTQNRDMVGAYGNAGMDTPNLDRLAAEGVRFDRAYTTCPLCTPARSAIFSGTQPTVNGAWCNNVPPYSTIPLMGTIFRHYGYRAAYTGKWHLDGSGYFGDGQPGGGFEEEWWYDGKRYAQEIGQGMFSAYRTCRNADELRAAGFEASTIWGHRVTDRAIDFLERVGDEPFVLAVSYDEPHEPYVAPPEYWDNFDTSVIPRRPNFAASLAGKPQLQHVQNHQRPIDGANWEAYREGKRRHYGCNAFIDREIGRVIQAVEALHGDDTTIIYTSDHGDMQGSHGLTSKGPMMYEEVANIPFIVRMPGGSSGAVSTSLVSHLDILPTMLELAGIPRPESLHGLSLLPTLRDPAAAPRRNALIGFTRFAINHDDWGEFYPIRCITDGRYKLAINLFDTDEFYDLAVDPFEMTNAIEDAATADIRDGLHEAMLAEMDRIRDPFRSYHWGARPWHTIRRPFYHGGARRNPPAGFPFQPISLEADGTLSNASPS